MEAHLSSRYSKHCLNESFKGVRCIFMIPAGMSVVNSMVSGEEGGSVTVECLYSERYRYLILLWTILLAVLEIFWPLKPSELYLKKHWSHVSECHEHVRKLSFASNAGGRWAIADSPVTACQQRKWEEVVSEWRLELLSVDRFWRELRRCFSGHQRWQNWGFHCNLKEAADERYWLVFMFCRAAASSRTGASHTATLY